MAAPARATPLKLPPPAPAAECKTVREILPPWHVIEKATMKRDDGLIDASADEWMPDADVQPDNDAEPPSSSIRLSDAGAPANASLSFKVYTLAELERRSDAPLSMRLSRVAFDSLPKRRYEKWRAMWAAFRALVSAAGRWAKTKNELGVRSSPKTLWPELDAFGNVAQVAVDSVDWKKHGVTLGTVVGATLTLLFGVLLCAEMTDDLKPGAGAHLAPAAALEVVPTARPGTPNPRSVAPATNMAAQGVQPTDPNAPAADDTVDDVDPPAPPTRPAPRHVNKKGHLTFRNADAIFNP